MVNKNVLLEAIRRLEILNQELRKKIDKNPTSKTSDNYLKLLAKNDSLILDYKFRIEHD